MDYLPLFSGDYLFSRWERDFDEYTKSNADAALLARLKKWAARNAVLTETQLEAQFIDLFFKQTWGFWGTGEKNQADGYCLNAQYGVDKAGQSGGKGMADLALGWWGLTDVPPIPQVLAEFKDIRTGLDTHQRRKNNDRSPVKQCFDYLKYAFDATSSRSELVPTWGLVTDMNEFRLYCRVKGDMACQRFVIKSKNCGAIELLSDNDEALFQRFVFSKIFSLEMLLAKHGKSELQKLLEDQIVREREFERGFYREYQNYREFVFRELAGANPAFTGATRGRLVKLTQRLLDRCLFILFCEDMGRSLEFPVNLLRDILIRESLSPSYAPHFANIWELVKQLFHTMRDGGPFPPDHTINRFNGGLFEDLPELDNLTIPNHVFCMKRQGESQETIRASKETLLYFSANYNFGAHGVARERTITLYTLGRIFEQSITDLEYMEAEAEGKDSLVSLTKRRRDGVYYTPEWVTDYIVRETIGVKLHEIRSGLGLELGLELPKKITTAYRQKALRVLDDYEKALEALKVLDPACGSGAFLIQALQFLLRERRAIADERARISQNQSSMWDMDAIMRSILANNLYGVDINPESVEITQLALWLHTALPGKPLSNLADHIRCGNSLVGVEFEEFYKRMHPGVLFNDLDEQKREDVNVFDWAKAFPDVLGAGVPEDKRGFDCVIGNPPYVKLQHFRKLKQDESCFFIKGRDGFGRPLYASAQTGNFDLYLLFVEKGISLLAENGLMGFIAPSLWLKNEYGQGLRQEIKRLLALDKWIDFKDFQVFEEAITYTALQFFSKKSKNSFDFFLAPGGESEVAALKWAEMAETLPYSELPDEGAWNLLNRRERDFVMRLGHKCESLEASSESIIVGIQTSADLIYHLRRVGSGRYTQIGGKGDGLEYALEDAIMKPLVSGQEAKRYQEPKTDTYLLFPYTVEKSGARLFTQNEMRGLFPKAWAYLKAYEHSLRAREDGKMSIDDGWWAYNYPKNIDKQEFCKLLVPRLVSNLFCVADENGEFYLDNVDVGGVLPKKRKDVWFLCGVLNAPVCRFVFQQTSKPFQGGYLSANKQYIASLPIPPATSLEKAEVGKLAKKLQTVHSARRDKIAFFKRLLYGEQCVDDRRELDFLWADVKNLNEWKAAAPAKLLNGQKTAWAKARFAEILAEKYKAVETALLSGSKLSVFVGGGEIMLLSGEKNILSIYVEKKTAALMAAQWRQIIREIKVVENRKIPDFIKALLSFRKTDNTSLRKELVELDAAIQDLDNNIAQTESALNACIYRLYTLSDDEIKLVERPL